jgi:hypothetical protein
MARPSEYSEEIIVKANEYLEKCVDIEDDYHQTRGEKSDSYKRIIRVKLPTIEGLAVYLNISRETVYDWSSKYPEFSDIVERLKATQAERLLNSGLSGDYNPIISKLILSKHGYVEKKETDVTSGGEKISVNLVNFDDYDTNNPAQPEAGQE